MPDPHLCPHCGKYSPPEATLCEVCGKSFVVRSSPSSVGGIVALVLGGLLLAWCSAVITSGPRPAPPLTPEQRAHQEKNRKLLEEQRIKAAQDQAKQLEAFYKTPAGRVCKKNPGWSRQILRASGSKESTNRDDGGAGAGCLGQTREGQSECVFLWSPRTVGLSLRLSVLRRWNPQVFSKLTLAQTHGL